jgi:hypothetical protein
MQLTGRYAQYIFSFRNAMLMYRDHRASPPCPQLHRLPVARFVSRGLSCQFKPVWKSFFRPSTSDKAKQHGQLIQNIKEKHRRKSDHEVIDQPGKIVD